MIAVVQNGDVYQLKFKYDPQFIELLKLVPGRVWSPNEKIWTIPKDRLGFLVNQLRGTVYENSLDIHSDEEININSTLDSTFRIPDIDISKIHMYVKEGSSLYSHQYDFMKFAIDRQLRGNMRGFILADAPGCGKTLEVVNLAIYNKKQYGMKHCLIICCVNSSKYNWREDIEDHTRGEYSGYILGSRRKRNGHIKYDTETSKKLEDLVNKTQCGSDEPWPFFIILNIEALRYKVGKSYPIADEIIKLINSGEIGMIAVDEIHKNTSHTSQQGKQLLRIYKSQTRTISWIPMTGTPIVNRPTDVFLPLRLVGGHDFKSFYQWAENFCIFGGYGDYEIVGYKNIPYLKSLLQDNMIRRRKEDVLDLPPKIYYTEYVENTGYQAKLYKQIRAELAKQKSEAVRLNHPDISFIRLRQVNGSPEIVDSSLSVNDDYIKYNAKLQRLMELLEDAISNGEKVLVFSNWVEPLRTLYRFVSKKYKTCCFTGTMSESDRQKNKRVFQNNPDYKVLLGTIGAAGTTHTFTAASTVIFYDEPWTPSDKSQAEDRAYRIGTTQSVKVYTIITQDTVDDAVHSLLYRKKGVSTYIVDNKLDLKNETVMDLLLGGE